MKRRTKQNQSYEKELLRAHCLLTELSGSWFIAHIQFSRLN